MSVVCRGVCVGICVCVCVYESGMCLLHFYCEDKGQFLEIYNDILSQ